MTSRAALSSWRFIVLCVALVGATAAAPAVAQEEVPFVVTPDRVTLAMLELAGVQPGDHVVDLGSGDGRIVITAAKRFGASGLGVEIDGDLVERSRAAARAAGVDGRVEFREQDLFATDLSGATVITMYLLPEVNLQLRPRLLALAPGTRVVSHDWHMGDWAPDRTVVIDVPDKPIGREKVSRVHLWIVPARIAGAWCAADARLDVVQRFGRYSAVLTDRSLGIANLPPRVFDGKVDAVALRSDDGATLFGIDPGALRLHEAARPGLPPRIFSRCRPLS